MMFGELFYNPTAWFALSVILVIAEGFDGSFSIFAVASSAALITSVTLLATMMVNPLVIFSIGLVLSYILSRLFFKFTASNKDINEID